MGNVGVAPLTAATAGAGGVAEEGRDQPDPAGDRVCGAAVSFVVTRRECGVAGCTCGREVGPPAFEAAELDDVGAEVDEEDEFFSRNFLLMLTVLNRLGCGVGAAGAATACEPNGTRDERTGATGLGSASGMGAGSASTTGGVGGEAGTGICSGLISFVREASSATFPGVSSGKLLARMSALAIDQSRLDL